MSPWWSISLSAKTLQRSDFSKLDSNHLHGYGETDKQHCRCPLARIRPTTVSAVAGNIDFYTGQKS
jgi:hypothetical protein